MTKIGQYFFNQLIASDQLTNTMLGGSPDETISSRVGRRWPDSWMRRVIDSIFGPDHCKKSIELQTETDEVI